MAKSSNLKEQSMSNIPKSIIPVETSHKSNKSSWTRRNYNSNVGISLGFLTFNRVTQTEYRFGRRTVAVVRQTHNKLIRYRSRKPGSATADNIISGQQGPVNPCASPAATSTAASGTVYRIDFSITNQLLVDINYELNIPSPL